MKSSIDIIKSSMFTLDAVVSGETPTLTEKEQKLLTRLKRLNKQYPVIVRFSGTSCSAATSLFLSYDHCMESASDAIVPPGPVTVKSLKQRLNGQWEGKATWHIDRIDIADWLM